MPIRFYAYVAGAWLAVMALGLLAYLAYRILAWMWMEFPAKAAHGPAAIRSALDPRLDWGAGSNGAMV